MRKGLLYLLPIMALTQMGASMPDLRADHHPNNQKTIAEDGRKEAASGIVDGAERGLAGLPGGMALDITTVWKYPEPVVM